jgi:hypothetical protein
LFSFVHFQPSSTKKVPAKIRAQQFEQNINKRGKVKVAVRVHTETVHTTGKRGTADLLAYFSAPCLGMWCVDCVVTGEGGKDLSRSSGDRLLLVRRGGFVAVPDHPHGTERTRFLKRLPLSCLFFSVHHAASFFQLRCQTMRLFVDFAPRCCRS